MSDNPHHFKYVPTCTELFNDVFSMYNIKENDAIIDYGAGKGRVLILSSLIGFRNIVGVELSPKLYEKAKNNIDNYIKSPKTKNKDINIQVFNVDASSVMTY